METPALCLCVFVCERACVCVEMLNTQVEHVLARKQAKIKQNSG